MGTCRHALLIYISSWNFIFCKQLWCGVHSLADICMHVTHQTCTKLCNMYAGQQYTFCLLCYTFYAYLCTVYMHLHFKNNSQVWNELAMDWSMKKLLSIFMYRAVGVPRSWIVTYLLDPLTCIGLLTGPKTECTLITLARKLALYACFCINGCNIKTERPTEKL